MLVRSLAALLGVFHGANGLAMLLAPRLWWAQAPGAADTGAFNPHFVADVGFAFLAASIAFIAFAVKPSLKLCALGASGFVVFHALLHLFEAARGHDHNLSTTFLAIAAPAFAGLVLAWPNRSDIHA